MENARHRYRTDPVFHRLVDMLRSLLHGNQATPSELREALMLAVYCEELENPSPVFARIEKLGKELAEDALNERYRVISGERVGSPSIEQAARCQHGNLRSCCDACEIPYGP